MFPVMADTSAQSRPEQSDVSDTAWLIAAVMVATSDRRLLRPRGHCSMSPQRVELSTQFAFVTANPGMLDRCAKTLASGPHIMATSIWWLITACPAAARGQAGRRRNQS